jgi:thymidine phosphorylase
VPKAPVVGEVTAPASGFVTAMDGEALGLVVVDLGGGRRVETDRINPAVGLAEMVGLGAQVHRGDPLCVLHAADEDSAMAAATAVQAAITIGDVAPVRGPLIIEGIT